MNAANLKDIEIIKANIAAYADAWNAHDAKLLSALFTEDADFVMVMGIWWKGRKEIERDHAELFSTLMRESRLMFTDTQIKFLKPDVAIAHSIWELGGQLTPDGEKLPVRTGILTSVMIEQDGNWRIVAAQNADTIRPFDYKPYNKETG